MLSLLRNDLFTDLTIANMFAKPELFWFFIGLGLFIAEMIIPGFFIFFFGLGAWVTALICLLWEPSVNTQIVIFAITSILSLAALRRIIQKKFWIKNGKETEVDVDDEFTGREATAAGDFGMEVTGKVIFKGSTWTAESSVPIREGQRVTIIRKENVKLIVEPKKY
jgi:membrane protein implicated in regulation of membrane protease activity